MPQRRIPTLDALQKAEHIGSAVPTDVTESVMPLDPTLVKSLGKPISELLGIVLKQTTPGTGLPARMRLGSFDRGKATLYGARKGSETFEATASELDDLLANGMMELEQPPQGAVDAIRRKLSAILDSALGPARPAGTPGAPGGGSGASGAAMTADRLEAALQRMVDTTPKGPTGRPITNPAGHLVDDVFDLPIMRGVQRPPTK